MIIKKTSKGAFAFSVINYLGTIAGLYAALFFYPNDKQSIGTIKFYEGIAFIIYPILVFGSSQALINFHAKLSGSLKNKIFNLSLLTVLLTSLFFLLLIFILSQFINPQQYKVFYFSFSIAVCKAFIEIFKKKAIIERKITILTIFENIATRLSIPILFYLLILNKISFDFLLQLYILIFIVVTVLSGLYLNKYFKEIFNLKFNQLFTEIPKKVYFNYSMFALAGSLGVILVTKLDSIIIPIFLTTEDNGNFNIAAILVAAIAVPANGLFAIYTPVISKYFAENNLKTLNVKYKEISIFLFFIGILMYSCLFVGVENLFLLLSTSQELLKSVPLILILGVGILINMGTGFNTEIISYSKKFKFNLFAITILIASNLILNIFFLYFLKLGINYVAIASLISITLFNLVKLIFIYKKFKLFPFNRNYFGLFITSISVLFFVNYIPNTINIFFNLVAKITLCLSLNFLLIYRLNFVKQFNDLINKFILK
jgi:O-antigen/teichoic acid export membrane protein